MNALQNLQTPPRACIFGRTNAGLGAANAPVTKLGGRRDPTMRRNEPIPQTATSKARKFLQNITHA